MATEAQLLADNYDTDTLLTAAGLKLDRDGHDVHSSAVFEIRDIIEENTGEEE